MAKRSDWGLNVFARSAQKMSVLRKRSSKIETRDRQLRPLPAAMASGLTVPGPTSRPAKRTRWSCNVARHWSLPAGLHRNAGRVRFSTNFLEDTTNWILWHTDQVYPKHMFLYRENVQQPLQAHPVQFSRLPRHSGQHCGWQHLTPQVRIQLQSSRALTLPKLCRQCWRCWCRDCELPCSASEQLVIATTCHDLQKPSWQHCIRLHQWPPGHLTTSLWVQDTKAKPIRKHLEKRLVNTQRKSQFTVEAGQKHVRSKQHTRWLLLSVSLRFWERPAQQSLHVLCMLARALHARAKQK